MVYNWLRDAATLWMILSVFISLHLEQSSETSKRTTSQTNSKGRPDPEMEVQNPKLEQLRLDLEAKEVIEVDRVE